MIFFFWETATSCRKISINKVKVRALLPLGGVKNNFLKKEEKIHGLTDLIVYLSELTRPDEDRGCCRRPWSEYFAADVVDLARNKVAPLAVQFDTNRRVWNKDNTQRRSEKITNQFSDLSSTVPRPFLRLFWASRWMNLRFSCPVFFPKSHSSSFQGSWSQNFTAWNSFRTSLQSTWCSVAFNFNLSYQVCYNGQKMPMASSPLLGSHFNSNQKGKMMALLLLAPLSMKSKSWEALSTPCVYGIQWQPCLNWVGV